VAALARYAWARSSRVNPGQDVMEGFDAADRVVWQMRLGASP
jgi:hypothetical protein